MKQLLLVLPLLFVAPSCRTAGAVWDALVGIPTAAASDVADTVTPDQGGDDAPPPEAEAAGSMVGTVVTLGTGNPAVGAGAAALVTGVVAWLVKRKKKPVVKKK